MGWIKRANEKKEKEEKKKLQGMRDVASKYAGLLPFLAEHYDDRASSRMAMFDPTRSTLNDMYGGDTAPKRGVPNEALYGLLDYADPENEEKAFERWWADQKQKEAALRAEGVKNPEKRLKEERKEKEKARKKYDRGER